MINFRCVYEFECAAPFAIRMEVKRKGREEKWVQMEGRKGKRRDEKEKREGMRNKCKMKGRKRKAKAEKEDKEEKVREEKAIKEI